MSPRYEGGRPGDDDESLERWEDELADLEWDDDVELDLTGDDEALDAPLDDEGRPLAGPGAIAPVWQRAIARLVEDRDLLERLRAGAVVTAQGWQDWDAAGLEFLRLLTAIAKQRRIDRPQLFARILGSRTLYEQR